MSNQKIRSNVMPQQATITTREQLEASGLTIVLHRVQHCFKGRVSTYNTELLELGLRHIFVSADLLYSILLPELTTMTNQQDTFVDNEDQSAPSTIQPPQTGFCAWPLLQELEALFIRLQPLCQLLNSATTNILEELDRSSSIYKHPYLQPEEHDMDLQDDALAASDVSHLPDNTYYQWMQAVRLLTDRLEVWQRANKERLLFVQNFTQSNPSASTLDQVDITLDALLLTLRKVFGTILPEFHTLEKGDDETIAMLLLDLIQKTDQTLLHLEALIEPLHALLHWYAMENTLL